MFFNKSPKKQAEKTIKSFPNDAKKRIIVYLFDTKADETTLTIIMLPPLDEVELFLDACILSFQSNDDYYIKQSLEALKEILSMRERNFSAKTAQMYSKAYSEALTPKKMVEIEVGLVTCLENEEANSSNKYSCAEFLKEVVNDVNGNDNRWLKPIETVFSANEDHFTLGLKMLYIRLLAEADPLFVKPYLETILKEGGIPVDVLGEVIYACRMTGMITEGKVLAEAGINAYLKQSGHKAYTEDAYIQAIRLLIDPLDDDSAKVLRQLLDIWTAQRDSAPKMEAVRTGRGTQLHGFMASEKALEPIHFGVACIMTGLKNVDSDLAKQITTEYQEHFTESFHELRDSYKQKRLEEEMAL